MLGPSRKQAGELPGAMHVEAVYLRGGGGRARGEAGRRRRVRDRAQSAHRNESESPPSAAPPRGPACARAPLPPTPGPCNQHAARVAPPPPYPSGLSPAGSTLSRRPTLVPGPRSVLEPSGRALRLPWVKGQVASFPGGGRRARSFTSAGRLEKPRKRAPFLPPPAAPFGGLRGVLATNRRARCRGRPLSRSRGGGPRAPAPARCVAFSRVPSRTSGLSLQRRPECRVRAAAARVMVSVPGLAGLPAGRGPPRPTVSPPVCRFSTGRAGGHAVFGARPGSAGARPVRCGSPPRPLCTHVCCRSPG